MKKFFASVLVMIVALSVFVPAVGAAPAQESKSVIFAGVSYQAGGVILLFHTSGLSKADLKNTSFFAHSNEYDMHCAFKDDTHTDVRCVLPKKLANYAGEGFNGTLAGVGFWGEFPANTYCSDGEIPWYTYDVFDNGEYVGSGEVPVFIWRKVASQGLFEFWESVGVHFDITDGFCGSADFGPA